MRMKSALLSAVAIAVLSLSSVVDAQTTTKQLFQPVSVSDSSTLGLPGVVATPTIPAWTFGLTTVLDAVPFASTTVFLSCPADGSGTASLSGSNDPTAGNSLIVDNFIRVTTGLSPTSQDLPSGGAGFSNQNVFPASNAGPYLGHPVSTVINSLPAYLPIPDQSFAVASGDAVYTISLMDFGYTYGSSAVWLKTTCKVNDKVCHRDNGAKFDKTLTVDPNGYAAHLANHPLDTPGDCADGH